MYLIELDGECVNVEIIPTVPREFSCRVGCDVYVDMNALTNAGFDGFLKVNNTSLLACDFIIASGMDACVQVRTRYKWQSHNITANVPVQTYCTVGWIKSIVRLVRDKLKT